jgi:hypothetical protein
MVPRRVARYSSGARSRDRRLPPLRHAAINGFLRMIANRKTEI